MRGGTKCVGIDGSAIAEMRVEDALW